MQAEPGPLPALCLSICPGESAGRPRWHLDQLLRVALGVQAASLTLLVQAGCLQPPPRTVGFCAPC